MPRALPLVVAVFVGGCRTAGPQIRLHDCMSCTIRIDGNIAARQGKSVPVDVLTDPTLSASQNGSATASRAAEAAPDGE